VTAAAPRGKVEPPGAQQRLEVGGRRLWEVGGETLIL
jgi:hypothetical protein